MQTGKYSFLLAMSFLANIASAQDVQEIAKKALKSTVSITFFNYAYSDKILGSGFVVADNIIATNYHVVSLGNEGFIQKSQTDTVKHYIKRLIAVDPENDLALIEVQNLGLPALPISTEELNVGEKIYVAGNPLGLTGTFSDGIVSANRKIEEKQVVQITAPVSSGSSGGPVLNAKGSIVGTVFSSYKAGQNLNFVVPAIKLVELLAKKTLPIEIQESKMPAASEQEMSIIKTELFNDEVCAKVKGMKVKQGQKSVLETNEKVNYMYTTADALRYKPDFTIETRLKTADGKQTCLYWGNLSHSDFNFTNGTVANRDLIYLFCNKGNKASLGNYEKGDFKKLEDDVETNSSKKDDYTILKIRKKVDSLFFSLNGEDVFKQPYRYFLGGKVGVGSEEEGTKITIDHLTVKQAVKKTFDTKFVDTSRLATKLPDNVNSKYQDFFPVVSPDGQTLYLTRYYSPQNNGKMHNADIYEGNITDPKSVFSNKKKYNTENDDYCFNTSNDGSAIYIEKINEGANTVRYKSFLNLYNLEKQEEKEISTFKSFYCYDNVSVYSLNKEENVITVSVKRGDTFGSLDLYFSKKDKNGNWSELINLGQVINTEYNEGSGFITADNKHLIFSSEGHPGYGEGDLFVSERLDSTWLNWSKPVNLGPGINTKNHEDYPFLHLKGNELYFNRTVDSNADIFKVELKPESKSNVTLGILQFSKVGLEVEITALPENTIQKFVLGERKKVHFVFQNGKKYKIKASIAKSVEFEKELDFTKRTGYTVDELTF